MKRLSVLASFVLGLSVLLPVPALAHSHCDLVQAHLNCDIEDEPDDDNPGPDPGPNPGPGPGSGLPPIVWVGEQRWTAEGYQVCRIGDPGFDGDYSTLPEEEVGELWWFSAYRRDTGEVIAGDPIYVCVGPGVTPPPPVPAAPSPRDIGQRVSGREDIQPGEISVNPFPDGLVQIDNIFTVNAPEPPVLNIGTISGWSVSANVSISDYIWRVDGVIFDRGSATGIHEFLRKGDFAIQVEIVWTGTYTVTGFGISETFDLPPMSTYSNRSYHVKEIRPGLVKPDNYEE